LRLTFKALSKKIVPPKLTELLTAHSTKEVAKLLTNDEARRIAANVANCPNFYANKKPRQSPGPSEGALTGARV
jgi:hypothetical protein